MTDRIFLIQLLWCLPSHSLLSMWSRSSSVVRQSPIVPPLKLDWTSGLTCNQQNLVEVILYDFWARKGWTVSALTSLKSHWPDPPSQRVLSEAQLPWCGKSYLGGVLVNSPDRVQPFAHLSSGPRHVNERAFRGFQTLTSWVTVNPPGLSRLKPQMP